MSRFLDSLPRRLFLSMGIIISAGLSGCDGQSDVTSSPSATINDWLPIEIDGQAIEIQIAFKNHELSKGLMFRNSMGENRGMLFFYDPPKQMSFYMRNTKIPLDIAYITSDGIVREIYPMYPMDERSVKSRRSDILMALEMNQDWFAKNEVRPGDAINLETLKPALLQRGIPENRIPF